MTDQTLSPRERLRAMPSGIEDMPQYQNGSKSDTQHKSRAKTRAPIASKQKGNPRRGNPQNLCPPRWKKGESGNPSGKSKLFFELQTIARANSPRAFERVVELVESEDERIALAASKEILDRAWGRPNAAPDEDGKDGKVTINILKLSPGDQVPESTPSAPMITLKRFSDG